MTDWTEALFYDSAREADTLLDRVVDTLRRRFPGLSLAEFDLLFADLRNQIETRLDVLVDQIEEMASINNNAALDRIDTIVDRIEEMASSNDNDND